MVGAEAMDALRERLLAKDWSGLATAGPASPDHGTCCAVDLHLCSAECGNTNTLTLRSVTTTIDNKGNTQTKEKTLIDRLLLTGAEAAALVETCESLHAPNAETPETAETGGEETHPETSP
jgi:hypothetical protein